MGAFFYGSPEYCCLVDDRLLLHLQIVIVDKLRLGERFAFRCDDTDTPCGATTFWMAPDIPVRFVYTESVKPEINRAWLNDLARAAITLDGVHRVDEPLVVVERELVGV